MSNLSKPFKVCISQTLSKNDVVVETDKYEVKDVERDEDGTEFVDYTTENVNWKEEYESQHPTPFGLIAILGEICDILIEKLGISVMAGHNLKTIMMECDDWKEDDFTVMEEEYGNG